MDEQENKQQEVEDVQTKKMQETQEMKREEEPLDTETTFADMNVEGFSWYDPKKKKGKSEKVSVSKKEYRAMVRGAFAAILPMVLCLLSAFAIVFLLAYLWLKP